jgi:hypothetical protein
MAYEGDEMLSCPPVSFNFAQTWAVVVSGAAWNPCGHLILNVGGVGGWYFHVAGVHTVPRYMNEANYQRYLKENGKKVLRVFKVAITDGNAAMRKLEQLCSEKWTWGILPHNCASFVEDVVQAGGSNAGLYSNCPAHESFD